MVARRRWAVSRRRHPPIGALDPSNNSWRVVWWTTDGTATAGTDYADRGRVTERFAVGEQNRTILIPLVGDRNVEGPENFYVHVAPGDAEADLDRAEQLEVVLNDDD